MNDRKLFVWNGTNYQLLIAPRGSRSYGTGGFEAVGTTPGQHWINAENLWRGKTR